MRKLAAIFLSVLLAFGCVSLTGCGKYRSSYSALVLITSNNSDGASMKFGTFRGTNVFKVKCGEGESTLKYDGKIKSGTMKVYYDSDGTKKELFTLHEGESVEATGGELSQGTVYIILESDGKCEDGDFHFEVV